MKYQKIMALALSACMMLACTSALGEGIIGSISGVKEGGDIMAADQGRLAMEDDDNAQTDSTNQPDATNAPDATQPAYAIDENARRLYLKLKDEAPIQEGWTDTVRGRFDGDDAGRARLGGVGHKARKRHNGAEVGARPERFPARGRGRHKRGHIARR